ncbi:MAG: hypothetical protein J5526_02305 [Bacteroidales bacterium]|nr:hypothetical protein [Bacteroidales bacterium]
MRNTITKFALTAALIILSTGCQKEEMIEPEPTATETTASKAGRCQTTVYYTVDGVMRNMTYSSDTEWYHFMTQMTALAREGHAITLSNKRDRPDPGSVLETIVYNTRIESDAIAWCKKMSHSGYTVAIRYYADTKLYHCLATRQKGKLNCGEVTMERVMR